MKNLIILGSTGSIGINTLDVVKRNINKFNIYALVAKSNVDLMTKQCLIFNPKYVCMTDEQAAIELEKSLSLHKIYTKIKVLAGFDSACELSALKEVDIVMSAIVGIAGLLPTLSALKAGKKVLLANKESLVTCGKILIKELCKNRACLIPVDSEHSAIFQSLPKSFQNALGRASFDEHGISRIILTASGGPFRNISLTELSKVTPKQACNHPNWSMGKKNSVDSATMMNKGLEYIAGRWLFNASSKGIDILLHPQSIIHSMVSYIDGSLLAQLSIPDMRIPIAYAMGFPERISINIRSLDLSFLEKLNFYSIDKNRYPCLQLAISASNDGQSASIILNAANEVAVEAFLNERIRFNRIADVIKRVLDSLVIKEPESIEEILWIDQQARKEAILSVNHFNN
ncbi:1-deoxy-D-xylulose-5-phosphate reductoisomerase [Blochmannia endosymbiont of Colobopsis nipponica]|uniref:1-deoxy-D-xylulose-5-phosphate reductoisomerase n=1 Tax=Blochmannia endosymbiont of Colobopsis nipponica TaxID=2681987 RepID=UPI0017848434|nr:1-deoxy-D-xylulose-5-phosphate reductoisomerase [Blochmannia endosymbiont of Colobopsis nipponica]QOI11160.1 1-deoxy-D-xylulose-5-phosphate reductoisomerase [Blochmannia endosymbiont of Colobopsis nipponica]